MNIFDICCKTSDYDVQGEGAGVGTINVYLILKTFFLLFAKKFGEKEKYVYLCSIACYPNG